MSILLSYYYYYIIISSTIITIVFIIAKALLLGTIPLPSSKATWLRSEVKSFSEELDFHSCLRLAARLGGTRIFVKSLDGQNHHPWTWSVPRER